MQIVELRLHRLEVGVQRLLEQASLLAVQLLAARGELPAPEHLHLVRQLIDLDLPAMQLPVIPLDRFGFAADLLVLLRNLLDQLRSQLAQLLLTHGCDLLMKRHARDGAIGFAAIKPGSLRLLRCDARASQSSVRAAARVSVRAVFPSAALPR